MSTKRKTAKLATQSGLKGSYEGASESSKQLDPADYGAEGAPSLEGFLYPSTYDLKPKSTADDLVSAHRAFEINGKVIEAADEALRSIASLRSSRS